MKEYLLGLLLLGSAFISPVEGTMMATGFMIFVALFSSLWRKYTTLNEFPALLGSELWVFLKKLVFYQLLIVTGLVMEKHLIPLMPVVSLVASVIAAREGIIVFDNVSVITGVDFLSVLQEKLASFKKPDA